MIRFNLDPLRVMPKMTNEENEKNCKKDKSRRLLKPSRYLNSRNPNTKNALMVAICLIKWLVEEWLGIIRVDQQ